MEFKYKRSAVPAIIYSLLSGLALIFPFLAPVRASLAGVYIGLLTMPWSMIGVVFLDSMQLYSITLTVINLVIGIIVNALILLFICGYFEKKGVNNKKDLS